jgi:hypothetical protein
VSVAAVVVSVAPSVGGGESVDVSDESAVVGAAADDDETVVDVGVGAGAVVCEALMLEDLVELDAGRGVVLFADATGAIGWLTDDD